MTVSVPAPLANCDGSVTDSLEPSREHPMCSAAMQCVSPELKTALWTTGEKRACWPDKQKPIGPNRRRTKSGGTQHGCTHAVARRHDSWTPRSTSRHAEHLAHDRGALARRHVRALRSLHDGLCRARPDEGGPAQ